MKASRWMQGILLGSIAALLGTGCAAPPGRVREIDPQAGPVLKRMCAALDGAKAFRFRVDAAMDGTVETGQLAQFHRVSDVAVVRPDKLHVTTDSDEGRWSVWYRGTSLTILDRDANTWATQKVPGRIDRMLDYMADTYNVVMPMADLLVGQSYDSLLAEVDSMSYVGLHTVGGTACHHLLCRQENIDWQIWIDSGKVPLPRKLVITYTQEPDHPQYVATMDGWNLTPQLPADTFTFAPPSDSRSIGMDEMVIEKLEEGGQ